MTDALVIYIEDYAGGEPRQIYITPVFSKDENGIDQHNFVYDIFDGENEAGVICFDEDICEWEYNGPLNIEAQEEVALAVRRAAKKTDDSFEDTFENYSSQTTIRESFKFVHYYEGRMAEITVLPGESAYGILINGNLAAEVELSDDGQTWVVSTGELGDDQLLAAIGKNIEDHFE